MSNEIDRFILGRIMEEEGPSGETLPLDRTLGEFANESKETDDVYECLFPGWDPHTIVPIPKTVLHEAGIDPSVNIHFGAKVNLGADTPEKLMPSDFEPLGPPTSEEVDNLWAN